MNVSLLDGKLSCARIADVVVGDGEEWKKRQIRQGFSSSGVSASPLTHAEASGPSGCAGMDDMRMPCCTGPHTKINHGTSVGPAHEFLVTRPQLS